MLLEQQLKTTLNNDPEVQGAWMGGSGTAGHDIDLIVCFHKLNFAHITKLKAKLEKHAKKKVSIIPVTKIVLAHQNLWSGKMARMVYKGVKNITGSVALPDVPWSMVKLITKREAPTELYYYMRTAIDKPEKRDEMTDLIVQMNYILQD